jgi:PAS domain S-box-containing protein
MVCFCVVEEDTQMNLEGILLDASKALLSADNFDSACRIALDAINSLFYREAQVRLSIATRSGKRMIVIAASGNFSSEPIGETLFFPEKIESTTRLLISDSGTSIVIPLNISGLTKGVLLVESHTDISGEVVAALESVSVNLSMALEIDNLKKSLIEEQSKNRSFANESIKSDGNSLNGGSVVSGFAEGKSLQNELHKFSSAVDQSADSIIITNRDGVIEYVNQAFEAITGYVNDEVIGKTPAILKSGRHNLHFYENLWKEILSGKVYQGVFINRRKNGEMFYEQMTITPLRDAQSNITHFISTGKDITERKRAEEEQTRLQTKLRNSAMEWRSTFDAIETPLIILDMLGRVVRVNECARNLIGRSYQDIIGRKISNFAQKEPWKKAAEMVNEISSTHIAISCPTNDESSGRSWDLATSLFNRFEIEEERIILIAREITSMVELQQSLRRSEVMSAMGRLVAGVAHEVRNPLFGISATLDAFETAITMQDETVTEKLSQGLQDEYLEYIVMLKEELSRLNILMQELLEYGKPPSLEISTCEVQNLISQSISLCAPLAKQLGINVTIETKAVERPVRLDQRRMIQVFRNLIENAIQHSPVGSDVRIEMAEVKSKERDVVVCRIKDSGPGFRPDDLPRLFEPFFTRRRGGTGLGLSIVQKIVEENQGKISLGNLPGGGAVVVVELPLS